MDIDTRLLRYFATVAEEGHLTRAAQRLFVSQPALTKQIRQIEGQLGVELFVRSRSGMALTKAGSVLAAQVPDLLAGWDAALRQTKAAASRAARVLRVGFIASAANEATQQIIGEFTRRRPGWRVDMRQADWSHPTAGLADGDADAALLRLPFPGQDVFNVEVLLTEPRWVALPESHRLAASAQIPFADLREEPFIWTSRSPAPPEEDQWRDYWLATDERDGCPVRIGSVTRNPDEWLTAIASGFGISLAPESAARFYQRPGVVYRPVTGVSPSQVGVAWAPADNDNPVVQDFVQCCIAHRTTHPDHVQLAVAARDEVLARVHAREPDRYRQSAARLGPGSNPGTVSGGDGHHDGQAEPEPVAVARSGALRAEPLKRLEEPVDLVRRHHRSRVGDGHDGVPGVGSRAHPGRAGRPVVPDGVVDQVGDQPFGQTGIAEGGGGPEVGLQGHAAGPGLVVAGGHDGADHVAQVESFLPVETALAAGQGEQRLDEPLLLIPCGQHPLAGAPQGARRWAAGRPAPPRPRRAAAPAGCAVRARRWRRTGAGRRTPLPGGRAGRRRCRPVP